MTPWSPINDADNPAPKDGTWIVIGKAGWDVFPKAKWGSTDAVDGVIMGWVFADHHTSCLVPNTSGDGFLGWAEDIEDGNMPTHWTPLPPGDVSERGGEGAGPEELREVFHAIGYQPPIYTIAMEVAAEVQRAEAKHAPLNSPHEAWSVIYEELEELREHVRGDTGRGPEARKEAIQTAAMGLRYVLNLCGPEPDKRND